MQTVKGRIIDIQDNSIILLTTQGEFLKRPLPRGDVQLGEEITISAQSLSTRLRYFASVASAAAVVALLLFQSIGTMAAPAYYVHVDIAPGTPSIELALSKSMRVVGTTALNKDGSKILTSTEIQFKSVHDAIETIVDTAEDMKYFAPDKENTVLISVASANTESGKNKGQLLSQEVRAAARTQLKASKASATLGVATVDNSVRIEALDKKGSINSVLIEKYSPSDKDIPQEYEVCKVVPGRENKTDSQEPKNKPRKIQKSEAPVFNNSISTKKENQSSLEETWPFLIEEPDDDLGDRSSSVKDGRSKNLPDRRKSRSERQNRIEKQKKLQEQLANEELEEQYRNQGQHD